MNKFVLVLALVGSALADSHWTYGDQAGWGQDCNGQAQSPINVISTCASKDTVIDETLKLKLEGFDKELGTQAFQLQNNGHSAQLTIANDASNPTIAGSSQGGNTYRFTQLHFHWNHVNNDNGTEHAIDGKRHALELHLVHWNTKYASATDAQAHKDGLSVLGVFFQVAEDEQYEDAALKPIVDRLEAIEEDGVTTTIESTIKLRDMLPKDDETFYKYTGSLTTPPCSEVVNWVVFPEIKKIGKSQMARFRGLKGVNEQPLSVTRDLQALNGRTISASRPDKYCKGPGPRPQGPGPRPMRPLAPFRIPFDQINNQFQKQMDRIKESLNNLMG